MNQITPKWVKDKRKEAGMTQNEFGEMLGVSRFAVSGWEKGHHSIPDDIATRIIEAGIRPAVEDATAPVTMKNHPECFVQVDGRTYFTMAHPCWYIDSPISRLAPDELLRTATAIAELRNYVPPTMETVVKLFIDNWPSAASLAQHPNNGWMYEALCKQFLRRHGRADLLPLIPHDATHDIVERAPRPTFELDLDKVPNVGDLDTLVLPEPPNQET